MSLSWLVAAWGGTALKRGLGSLFEFAESFVRFFRVQRGLSKDGWVAGEFGRLMQADPTLEARLGKGNPKLHLDLGTSPHQ